ncbi:hypothetical protein [Rhodanobacter fulvus]|nr:hypothetical protein [Rhodanobacter fulvus]
MPELLQESRDRRSKPGWQSHEHNVTRTRSKDGLAPGDEQETLILVSVVA